MSTLILLGTHGSKIDPEVAKRLQDQAAARIKTRFGTDASEESVENDKPDEEE